MFRQIVGLAMVLFVAWRLAGFQGCEKQPVPQNRMSVFFTREGRDLSEVVTGIYGTVKKGGYIYVAMHCFTDMRVADALIAAKERGVDVKILAHRELDDKKENEDHRKLLIRLKEKGIEVRTNKQKRDEQWLMHMKVSVVNDRYVITGSCNYTKAGFTKNEENMLVIPGKVDRKIVGIYKERFLRIWEEGE